MNKEQHTREFNLQFRFIDDDSNPYRNVKYIARFTDGSERRSITDKNGYAENFNTEDEQEIDVRLLSQNVDINWGDVNG